MPGGQCPESLDGGQAVLVLAEHLGGWEGSDLTSKGRNQVRPRADRCLCLVLTGPVVRNWVANARALSSKP